MNCPNNNVRCDFKQKIQERALKLANITMEEALLIDDVNITIAEYTLTQLAIAFYNRIEVLPKEYDWFKQMFSMFPIEDRVQNQSEFLIQRFGGPCYYFDRRGHSNLILKHSDYAITEESAEKWLELMNLSINEFEEFEISLLDKVKLRNYFRYTAFYLVAAQEIQLSMTKLRTDDI
jgi:truncated hemoglobin YjbI